MARAEQIVGRVRECLAHWDGTPPAQAGGLAEQLSVSVDEVNRRLERCVGLLRRGLGSEALHQAELAPPVLEEAAAFDFPEWEQWRTACEEAGLGLMPRVNAQAVIEIDEAYPRQQRLERLLRTHRRLALGRAPLKARIKVLRRLSQADPDNGVWGDDLTTFEKARHQELAVEAQAAHRQRNLTALRAAQEELHELWLEKPSSTLVRSVDNLTARLTSESARLGMAKLETRLHEAWQAQDVAAGREAMSAWDAAAALVNDGQPLDPQGQVDAARQWLAQVRQEAQTQAAFDRALADLEAALDAHASFDDLERQWAVAAKFERPVPAVLQRRYEARLGERRLAASRRHRLVLVSVAGALLLAGGVVAYTIHRGIQAQEVQRWRQQIAQLVEQRQWPEAERLLARLASEQPRVRHHPDLEPLAAQVAAAMQAEAELARQLAELQQLLRSALAQVFAGGDDPDLDAMDEASGAVNRARELAAEDARTVALLALAAPVEQRVRQVQAGRFNAAVAEHRGTFTAWRQGLDAGNGDDLASLRSTRDELSRLMKMRYVAQELRDAADLLGVQIRDAIQAASNRAQLDVEQGQALQRIAYGAASPQVLANELAAFAQKFPTHRLASDFARSAKFGPLWAAADAWSSVLRERDTLRVESHGEGLDLLGKLLAFEQKHAHSPHEASVTAYREYLQRATMALDPQNAPDLPDGELDRLLSHPLVRDLLYLEDNQGRQFFMRDKPEEKPTRLRVYYIRSFSQAFSGGVSDIRNGGQFSDLTPRPAPQSVFATAARKHLRERGSGWETLHMELLDQLLATEKMDPILRLTLANELSRLSRERDWRREESLAAWQERLGRINSGVAWMDPEDAEANRVRPRAADAMNPTPDVAALRGQFQQWMTQMQQELAPRRALGVLLPGDGGQWTIQPAGVRLADGELEMVTQETGGLARFVVAATVRGGTVQWRPNAELTAGTIVYQRP